MSDDLRPKLFVKNMDEISEVIAAAAIVIGDYAMEGRMRRSIKISYDDHSATEILAVLKQYVDIQPFQ